MNAYVIIERQYSTDLAIEYPDADAAEAALEGSLFIDGLCEEDCLDAYVLHDDQILWPDPLDYIIPPTESTPVGLTNGA